MEDRKCLIMEKEYYKTTKYQIGLFFGGILLITISSITASIIAVALLCLVSMNMLTLHFIVFKTTRNKNKLNNLDFIVQILLFLFSVAKFVVLTS